MSSFVESYTRLTVQIKTRSTKSKYDSTTVFESVPQKKLILNFHFQKAPSIDLETVKDIPKLIETRGKANDSDSNEITIPYAIIRGSVVPLKASIESQYEKGLKGVIREFTISEHVRKYGRTGFWLDTTKTIQHTSNHVPFSLNRTVKVLDIHLAEIDLDAIYDKFDPAANTLGDHVWGWVIGDRQKGVQFTESMLVDGTDLTGIGELVLNTTDGGISLQVCNMYCNSNM